jgi:hypothetical protein
MKKARGFLVLAALLVTIPASAAFGGGAGGISYDGQYFYPGLTSSNIGMTSITGYGYGVSWDGSRFGGFGKALLSAQGIAAGGAGGILAGHEWRAGPFVVALDLLMGVGGMAFHGGGYAIAFGQADFEIGVTIVPWMQISAYAGYQAWGNLVPGFPFSNASLYTPVLGVRLAWGGF